jgi:hypothetical protein
MTLKLRTSVDTALFHIIWHTLTSIEIISKLLKGLNITLFYGG